MPVKRDNGAELSAGMTFRFQGSASDFRNTAGPFFEGAEHKLRKMGFVDASEWLASSATSTNAPFELAKRTQTFRADIGLSGVVVGIIVFLGSTVGSWAVSKVCDEIYEKGIRPHLRATLKRLAKKRQGPPHRGLVFQFGVWFAADNVYVQVIMEIDPVEDGEKLQALIPQAFVYAREWLDKHGVTHRFVTYRISGGQLSSTPQLSHTLPK